MKRQRTAEEIGDLNIEMAARAGRPSGGVGGIDGHFILNVPHTREPPGAEPADVSRVNGRKALDWEQPLIEAARMRDRAREWRP